MEFQVCSYHDSLVVIGALPRGQIFNTVLNRKITSNFFIFIFVFVFVNYKDKTFDIPYDESLGYMDSIVFKVLR